MNKKLALVTIVALIIFSAIQTHRACQQPEPDATYWVSRAAYDQAVEDMTAGLQESFRQLAESDALITKQHSTIATSQEKIATLEGTLKTQSAAGAQLEAETARLRQDAQAAIDSNPTLRALVDAFDLRCANYESRILTLTTQAHERDTIIEAQGIEIIQLRFQRDTWRKAWGDEHALRLAGDSLRIDLERHYKTSKTWAAIGKWGPPVAFSIGLLLGK